MSVNNIEEKIEQLAAFGPSSLSTKDAKLLLTEDYTKWFFERPETKSMIKKLMKERESRILKPGKPKAGDIRPPFKQFKWNNITKKK